MTLAEIRSDVKGRCAINDSTLDGVINTWINHAVRNIIRRYTWEFLYTEGTITTANGTETYSLEDDVMRILTMRDTTNTRKIDPMRTVEFYSTYPNPTATGAPTIYRLSGATQANDSSALTYRVSLYPIPDSTYTIKYTYFKRVDDSASDDNIPYIPAEYHELLSAYAAAMFWQRVGDPRAESEMRIFTNGLRDMVEALSLTSVEQIDTLEMHNGGGAIPPAPQFPSTFGRVNW